jgi:hypothetical protein
MNEELIRKLAERSGFTGVDFSNTQPGTCHSTALSNFAVLIVKECVAQCKNVENDDELSDYAGGFRDGAVMCQEEINEHFGVK